MSADFEPPIDSDLDLLESGQRLFISAGAGNPEDNMFLNMYRNSPQVQQRELGKQVWANKDTAFFNTFKGLFPMELELDLMENGKPSFETCWPM